jgi:hypothetical protein
MLATCQQHVGNVSKSHQIWVDMHVGANTKSTPTQEFCAGNHQQIVDTVVHTDTLVHTPRGGNTVGKLNESKSSGHVNVLRLVRHWYAGGAAAVANFFGVSLTTVVAVAAVAAWRQRQRQRGQRWTTIGSESSRQ